MTEDELRRAMLAYYEETLPSDERVAQWAKAAAKRVDEVKAIYGEVIGDDDPWGPPAGFKDDGQ